MSTFVVQIPTSQVLHLSAPTNQPLCGQKSTKWEFYQVASRWWEDSHVSPTAPLCIKCSQVVDSLVSLVSEYGGRR